MPQGWPSETVPSQATHPPSSLAKETALLSRETWPVGEGQNLSLREDGKGGRGEVERTEVEGEAGRRKRTGRGETSVS